MASQGGVAFLDKVKKMINKRNGKPALKPNKALILKDRVGNGLPKTNEATCITELSVMMACWKANNFLDTLCSKEIDEFYGCVKYQAALKKDPETKKPKDGRMHPKKVQVLLKRFPTQVYEI